VDAANPAFSSLDGVLFNKARTKLLRCPEKMSGSYTIPGTVTAIGYGAFDGCAALTTVAMPEGVTQIDSLAFRNCAGLAAVPIPGSVAVIGPGAFEGCTGLTSVSIPNSVTQIADSAFQDCTGLAAVFIGRGVTDIGYRAFHGCSGLTGFTVDGLNAGYRSDSGVLFTKSPDKLIQFPAKKSGPYSVPDGVTDIGNGDDPFDRCTSLTSVTVPASVTTFSDPVFSGCSALTSIDVDPANPSFFSLDGVVCTRYPFGLFRFPTGRAGIHTAPAGLTWNYLNAFAGCTGLRAVVFQGDAPAGGNVVFADTAPGFTAYFFHRSYGFTSPVWNGAPSVMIDRDSHPAAEWLLGHGLPWNADLRDDPNGDGVSLLMAYALNLNPNLNLRASLPVPLIGPQSLSLSFHGARPGITYTAETSTDLLHWTTDGVILSVPGADGRRTASIPRDRPVRYLRLKVAH
jgi:hypothetical protein